MHYEELLPSLLAGSAGRCGGISNESSINISKYSPLPVVEIVRAYSSKITNGGSKTPRSYFEMYARSPSSPPSRRLIPPCDSPSFTRMSSNFSGNLLGLFF